MLGLKDFLCGSLWWQRIWWLNLHFIISLGIILTSEFALEAKESRAKHFAKVIITLASTAHVDYCVKRKVKQEGKDNYEHEAYDKDTAWSNANLPQLHSLLLLNIRLALASIIELWAQTVTIDSALCSIKTEVCSVETIPPNNHSSLVSTICCSIWLCNVFQSWIGVCSIIGAILCDCKGYAY
jgi:hypothetical protein